MSEGDMTVGGYQLKNCIASGSHTQIWEVTAMGSPMQLAMKLMLDESRKDGAQKAILKHEYKVGSSLDHPSFLRFHDIEMNRDHAFFVMDYFRSPSLKNQITSNLIGVQASFSKLAAFLAQAYFLMHESGWLHRDIKPDNILMNRAGECRVIDFSLSSRIKGALGKMLGGKEKQIQGTRTYIAPETILRKPATEQTDMYSLGVTFFEILTGAPPFAGDTPNVLLKKHLAEAPTAPSYINDNVTKELDRIVLRMLDKKPENRFQTMQELESALRSVKCFEVDPQQLLEEKLRKEKELAAQSVDKRLDSRADADRTEKGIVVPIREKKKKEMTASMKRDEAIRAKAQAEKDARKGTPGPADAAPAAQQQPQAPNYPAPPIQVPQPGMPMHPMPGQMMPGMGMPMPHQMMPGQMMPNQQPQFGQMPPQQMPMPGQMPPNQQIPPPQPIQQQPQQPQPIQQQPAPAPAPVARNTQAPPPTEQLPQNQEDSGRKPISRPADPEKDGGLEEATFDDFLIE
ncbi:MAG: serine/threonine-protein kinase [Fuerstiella sp.]